MTDEQFWMRLVYDCIAFPGSVMAMYVMVKYSTKQRSKGNRDRDPVWLRDCRRGGFFVAASLLLFSAAYTGWDISIPVLLLLASNFALLAFNAISYYMQPNPPNDGVMAYHGRRTFGQYVVELVHARRRR
jgi:hypothetical protein